MIQQKQSESILSGGCWEGVEKVPSPVADHKIAIEGWTSHSLIK